MLCKHCEYYILAMLHYKYLFIYLAFLKVFLPDSNKRQYLSYINFILLIVVNTNTAVFSMRL